MAVLDVASVVGVRTDGSRAARARHGGWTPAWNAALVAVAIGTLLLTGWGVGASMSDYYGSIALSMSTSWSTFFFGALDPSGTVTLDKIPGSFWVPALFVRTFGFSPWAVVFPNALAATGAAVLTAVTARRWGGPVAGIVAGAIVGTTPILVAVARSNQPETFFVLSLAATAWAATRALDRRSAGWLAVAGVFIAAGFQTYMLEAWAVWPALAAAYLCTRQSWARRIGHLALAGTLSIALSLTWIVTVALIPAAERPYIGSTLSNNPWEMVFGYNGLGRFGEATADASAYRSFTPPFSGQPAVFRLLNEALAAQIGWLLPTAVAAIVVLIAVRMSRPLLVFGAVWFVTFAAMFSLVEGMHQFYTASLAIPVALLVATAFAFARRRRSLWAQLLLVMTGALTALAISLGTPETTFSVPVALVQCLVAVGFCLLVLWERRRGQMMRTTAVLGALALILTPGVWSVVTIGTPNSTNPVAGGVSTAGPGGFGPGGFSATGGMPGPGGAPRTGAGPGLGTGGQRGSAPTGAGAGRMGGVAADADTIAWLEANRGAADYLAAAFGAQSAASMIVSSGGDEVLPIGGFNGQDPAPTLAAFRDLVTSGALRYVVAGSGVASTTPGVGETTSAQIRQWVLSTCTEVDDAPISGVYDCAG